MMDGDKETASIRPSKGDKKKGRQLECVNRRCKDGKKLVLSTDKVCRYYGIKYKHGQMVCSTCLSMSLKFYRHGEKVMKEGKRIMESKLKFPNFENHPVTSSSSEDESELQSSTSASNLTPHKMFNDCLKLAVNFIINENKQLAKRNSRNSNIIAKQRELCDDYVAKRLKLALQEMKEDNETLVKLENEIYKLEKTINEFSEAIITNESCVDIDDTAVNVPVNKEDRVTMIAKSKSKQKCVQETSENNRDRNIFLEEITHCNVPADLPRKGIVEYPPLCEGQTVYAKTGNDPECWQKCKIEGVAGIGLIVECRDINGWKVLPHSLFAYISQNPVQYHVGCRVISKYTQDNASIGVKHFYAGVIAEPPTVVNSFRYMIFFDDGRVQYQHHKDIRLIAHEHQKVWNEIYSTDNSYIEFLQQYLEKYPHRVLRWLTNNTIVTANSGGQWMSAKVVEIDASLVKLKFLESGEMEWLYRGSFRLLNIHNKLKGFCMKQSGLECLNKPFVESTTTEEESIIDGQRPLSRKQPTDTK